MATSPPTEAPSPALHQRRACPADCGRRVASGHLLCGQCWRRVPKDLQREVYATWRTLRASRARTDEAYVDKLRAYRTARETALVSIR